ncbi:MAG: MBL fold metallo-hydrolase [SAR116 cluster bacterium]|nr:MAG: MBL fold metallo-hydrolase [SAR116 cluster bacterium]|tara:strand:+ start:560 stop:1444 length:885 start_codon:yes stop_codon:yes gene_type:complete
MQDYPVNMAMKPIITAFFDVSTNTISYAVCDPITKSCAVIDSVMDIDYASGRITHDNADRIVDYITKNELTLDWIIETHVHADHLSAAPYLQEKLGGKIGISARITEVQEVFGKIFNEGTDFQRDGTQFDTLFQDGDHYNIGDIDAFVMATPGHTPACMVHVIGNAAFVGDTMFMPDAGSARADFPGGDAGELYDSIQKILTLPDEMRLYMCHDYGPNDRAIAWETTIAEQRAQNIHIAGGVTRQDFIKLRNERDASLVMPKLIIPSLQVNMRAGEVPEDADGRPVLKVPLNQM